KVCSNSDGYQESGELWHRLLTTAVKEAFSTLHHRGGDCSHRNDAADLYENVFVGEISVWGNNYQERYTPEQTTCLLEQCLRRLDPMRRTVFVLRDIERISSAHIAKIVNRSVAAVEFVLLCARLQ